MPVKTKPVDYDFNTLTTDIIRVCMREWGHDAHDHNLRILPFIGNNSHIVALNIRSKTSKKAVVQYEHKQYFLKQFPWYCENKDHVDLCVAFEAHLTHNKIPVAHLMYTTNELPYVHLNNHFYTMHEYVPGDEYEPNLDTVRNVGRCLGRLHNVSQTFNWHSTRRETIINTAEDMVSLIKQDDLKSELRSTLQQVATELSQYDEMACFVHGDCNPSNFIFRNREVAALIDFDNLMYDNPVRDLAEAILTFSVVQYVKGTSNFVSVFNPIDTHIARELLAGYQETAPDIYEAIRQNIVPACKAILVELFALGLLREDFGSDTQADFKKVHFERLELLIKSHLGINGLHFVDTFMECQCEKELLIKHASVQETIRKLISDAHLEVVGEAHHDFTVGYTAAWLLQESHITIHTWPELNLLNLDIYVCNYVQNNSEKVSEVYKRLQLLFQPKRTKLQKLIR